jgi:DNA (cytosine-5)-methyltransferase 1
MKILNLYSGIGGNRRLWSSKHDITSIEKNKKIASIYSDIFPSDRVIVTDAHQYLLENYKDYDFIWSSPPCQSHSILRLNSCVKKGVSKPIYPDMKLYEEILFLKYHTSENQKWVVENVKGYYKPLIPAQTIQRHLFWSNFYIPKINLPPDKITEGTIMFWSLKFGFNLWYLGIGKLKKYLLRNVVDPILGEHILHNAFKKQTLKEFI